VNTLYNEKEEEVLIDVHSAIFKYHYHPKFSNKGISKDFLIKEFFINEQYKKTMGAKWDVAVCLIEGDDLP
jgi:hypothetical protein